MEEYFTKNGMLVVQVWHLTQAFLQALSFWVANGDFAGRCVSLRVSSFPHVHQEWLVTLTKQVFSGVLFIVFV